MSDHKHVEVSIRFLDSDYKDTRDIYVQRLNYEWVMFNRPTFVQQIVATVNDLDPPEFATLAYMEPTK